MELIHDMGARPDAPQDAQEQSFAIEVTLFSKIPIFLGVISLFNATFLPFAALLSHSQ